MRPCIILSQIVIYSSSETQKYKVEAVLDLCSSSKAIEAFWALPLCFVILVVFVLLTITVIGWLLHLCLGFGSTF